MTNLLQKKSFKLARLFQSGWLRMTFLFAIIRIILKDKRTVNDNESWSIAKGRFNQEDNFFVNEPDHQGRPACYKRTIQDDNSFANDPIHPYGMTCCKSPMIR